MNTCDICDKTLANRHNLSRHRKRCREKRRHMESVTAAPDEYIYIVSWGNSIIARVSFYCITTRSLYTNLLFLLLHFLLKIFSFWRYDFRILRVNFGMCTEFGVDPSIFRFFRFFFFFTFTRRFSGLESAIFGICAPILICVPIFRSIGRYLILSQILGTGVGFTFVVIGPQVSHSVSSVYLVNVEIIA